MVQIKKTIAMTIAALISISLCIQIWQVYRFMNAGSRFTGADGKSLCERVAALERQAGLNSLPCHYGEK